MKSRVMAGLALVVAGAHFAIAQMPGKKNPLTQLSGLYPAANQPCLSSVVEILVTGYATVEDEKSQTATRISRQNSSGSGVIVDPAGYIMTNAHVVQGAVRLQVLIPEVSTPTGKLDFVPIPRTRPMDARVIGVDSESDLALIRIGESELPSLGFGDSDRLRQGDLVFAIGSPMGLPQFDLYGCSQFPRQGCKATIIPSSISKPMLLSTRVIAAALLWIRRACLIGLNTFIVSRSGGNEGLGFAIPSNVVRNVFEQLKNKGKVSRGSIGLFVQDVSPVMAKGLGLPLPQGVVIADVEPDSPGDIAGFKRRDIVLSLNTRAVETARQFDDDIYRRQGGETITLVIQRSDARLTVSARVKEQSAPWDPLASLASPEKNLIPGWAPLHRDRQKTLPGCCPAFAAPMVLSSPPGRPRAKPNSWTSSRAISFKRSTTCRSPCYPASRK